MKAAFETASTTISLNFSMLFTLTAILCLAAVQSLGVNASLSLATAATLLVFCARRTIPSTWEILINAYFLKSAHSPKWR